MITRVLKHLFLFGSSLDLENLEGMKMNLNDIGEPFSCSLCVCIGRDERREEEDEVECYIKLELEDIIIENIWEMVQVLEHGVV